MTSKCSAGRLSKTSTCSKPGPPPPWAWTLGSRPSLSSRSTYLRSHLPASRQSRLQRHQRKASAPTCCRPYVRRHRHRRRQRHPLGESQSQSQSQPHLLRHRRQRRHRRHRRQLRCRRRRRLPATVTAAAARALANEHLISPTRTPTHHPAQNRRSAVVCASALVSWHRLARTPPRRLPQTVTRRRLRKHH